MRMKRFIERCKMAALLCVAAVATTACLSDDESKTVTVNGFFTIQSGALGTCKLLEDGGAVVYPTMESVNALTDNKGFGDHKRAQFYYSYDAATDLTQDEAGNVTIKNAKLGGGQYIETAKVLDRDAVDKINGLATDSIFPVQSFSQFWLANGYLNTILKGQYSSKNGKAIRPSISLFLPEDAINENEVAFTILYNRHSSKNENAAGISDFINSFDISDIKVPGSDSITMTITVMGASPLKVKMPRKAFK